MKPLTVGLLVSGSSGFIVDTSVGRLRSRAGASRQSKERRRLFEEREGRRPYESPRVVREGLGRLEGGRGIVLVTDKKALYARVVREVFREGQIEHRVVSGRGSKGPWSELFWANHTAAKVRYGMSRLIRRSWCGSKSRRHLAWHLASFTMWHNGSRWRTNRSKRTPAMEEGLFRRRLTPEELFGWRQDWGARSRRLDAA